MKLEVSGQILMKLEVSGQIFGTPSNVIKFHEIPSSGSRVVPCGRTDMTKLRVAFRNISNARKKCRYSRCCMPVVKHCSSVLIIRI